MTQTESPTPLRSPSGFDLTPPSDSQRVALEADLSPEEKRVLLAHGTEAPFCGTLLGETTRVSIELMLREPQKYHIALQKYARAGALLSGKTTGALEEDIENLLAMLDFWIKETNIARLVQFGITEQDFPKILDKTDCKNAPVTLSREQLGGILAARL